MAESQDKNLTDSIDTTDTKFVKKKQLDFALEVPRGRNAKPYESDADKIIRQRQNSARYYHKHKEKILKQRKEQKESTDQIIQIDQLLETNELGLTAEQIDKLRTLRKRPEVSH